MLRSERTDFDFAAKVVLIREKKRDTSADLTYRSVPITPQLEKAMRTWFGGHPGGPMTLCTAGGEPVSVMMAAKCVVDVLAGTNWSVLPGWHCFRHSFISNCVARGIDQRMIDFWVGHSTEAMRRRYSHLIPKASQDALSSVFGT
jgi:integrase